jgi:hypothetical protein
MIDEKLYRETFSRLRASDEAKQEVIMRTADMNEKKTRRPLKALRAAAIAAMLTVALAVTANAASNGALFENLRIVWQNDSQIMLENNQGNQVLVSGVFADAELQDGKLVLTVDGTETDITQEIEEHGTYNSTVKTADGRDVDVTVTGTLENCEVQLSSRDGDMDYNVAAESSTVAESHTSVTATTVTD